MAAQITAGRRFAHSLRQEPAVEYEELGTTVGVAHRLVAVLVGSDPDAQAYEPRPRRLCERMDVPYTVRSIDAPVDQDDLVRVVEELDKDPDVAGLLLLRPLLAAIEASATFSAIHPGKDVEGLPPEHALLLAQGVHASFLRRRCPFCHLLDAWLNTSGGRRDIFDPTSSAVLVGRPPTVGRADRTPGPSSSGIRQLAGRRDRAAGDLRDVNSHGRRPHRRRRPTRPHRGRTPPRRRPSSSTRDTAAHTACAGPARTVRGARPLITPTWCHEPGPSHMFPAVSGSVTDVCLIRIVSAAARPRVDRWPSGTPLPPTPSNADK